MRRGYRSSVVNDSDGKFIGFYMGSDFCAEHEWGIGNIRNYFGIPKKGIGIVTRKISEVPESLKKFEETHKDGTDFYLIFGYGYCERVSPELILLQDNLGCAWSNSSFGIHVDSVYRSQLEELYEAFQRKDVCIFLGGGGVFENSGLVICIASRISADTIKMWEKHDRDVLALKQASDATGIEEILKVAGKRWHALSPRWASAIKGTETKYSVVYWLNPMYQKENNFGWYTVEDLKLWAEDKGPVIKV